MPVYRKEGTLDSDVSFHFNAICVTKGALELMLKGSKRKDANLGVTGTQEECILILNQCLFMLG